MGRSKGLSRVGLSAGITLLAAAAPAATPSPITSCPYTISAPGSYAVVNNLVSSGTCITILANGVILDLQGHTITGNGTGHGIIDNQRGGDSTAPVQTDITIKNGVISHFGTGVATSGTEFATITEIIAQQNTFDGIDFGNSSTMTSTSSLQNGRDGIEVGGNSSVVDVQADRNGRHGFRTDAGNLSLTNVEASSNGGYGVNIFYNLTVFDSSFENNASGGILLTFCCAVVINSKVNNNQ